MSKEKRRVPKLRFPGFTEDWEQRKVNDIFKITRGQVLATLLTTPKKTSQNIYPVYSSQTKNNGLMGYYSEYLFENAITWTTDGANAGTVNFRPGRFYSTNVNGVLINENGYACYAVSEIINKVAYKYVSKVGNPKLMNNVMSEINIMITPDIDELEQISKLIEAYNQYITLHQRKLEHLNLKKKALLQKLFPKNGERYPELRFPGFTDAWEQRKVNDIFKITRGQVLATLLTTPKKTSQNIYPVYSSQTKNNGLMGYYSEYLFENAITWTTDGANAGTVNFRPGRFYSTNVNGVLINENGYACYAVSEIINKVAYKYVSKVGNPKLMNNVMSEINIMITPDIDELEQISKLIEAYNQYITLHQRKLEHLQLQKKALLQQMFV